MAGIIRGSISGSLTRIFKKVVASKVRIDKNKLKVQTKDILVFVKIIILNYPEVYTGLS
jgi:hypothetical protein